MLSLTLHGLDKFKLILPDYQYMIALLDIFQNILY